MSFVSKDGIILGVIPVAISFSLLRNFGVAVAVSSSLLRSSIAFYLGAMLTVLDGEIRFICKNPLFFCFRRLLVKQSL